MIKIIMNILVRYLPNREGSLISIQAGDRTGHQRGKVSNPEEEIMAGPTIGGTSGIDRRAGKYLTFVLASEDYGVEILKVREIIGLMETTAVPGMPPYVNGVINLRGKVIPVIDMRTKFGMDSAEHTSETCIIVVDVRGSLIGVVVDKVSEVLDILTEEIEDSPNVGVAVENDFILGMAKSKGRVKILLDIDRVLLQGAGAELLETAETMA
jgi:purine-binding chemotaxis protein CheW